MNNLAVKKIATTDGYGDKHLLVCEKRSEPQAVTRSELILLLKQRSLQLDSESATIVGVDSHTYPMQISHHMISK